MAVQFSIQKLVSDGTLGTVALGIQYLQRNDIYMRIAGVETPQSGAVSGYTWSFIDNTTLKILPVIPNGVEVVVYRRTDIDAMYNIYSQNAQFDEATIDENNQQLLYIAQEYLEQGLPGAGIKSLEYVNTVAGVNYYRFKLTDGTYTLPFGVPDGTVALRTDLLSPTGAANVKHKDNTLDVYMEHFSNPTLRNAHKYHVLYELVHQFTGYTSVVASEGYNYMYATGHTFDDAANELWVAYQADGGDNAQWYVVYNKNTLQQKTYFKCGRRWTKSFNLHYTSGMRLLYGRGANSYLAVFDVTTLPSSGGTVPEYSQPKSNIGALFSGMLGGDLLVAHRGQTTNAVTQFNTYLAIDPSTFAHKKVYRLNTVAAGGTDGISDKLYKTQGLCFHPTGIALAHGGFVNIGEDVTKDVAVDYRSIQGVILRTPNGEPQTAGLFDPFLAMSKLASLGYTVNRFETEGLNYNSNTGQLTTLWQIDGSSTSKYLIVQAFSSHIDAIDLTSCAVPVMPNVPEIMSLYRDDQNGAFPHDPVTGQQLTDVTDLCNMMIRYDQREMVFYTANFPTMTFNGAVLVGSAKAKLVRGTNTTFFFELRSSGVDQQWLITVSGSTFSYARLDAYATAYRFEGTLTGDFIGNGSPEGVVVASPGSTYRSRLGGAGTTLYAKVSGAGTATGWVAVG